MSLQRRVTWSPPSSEGRASPTLVPSGSGVGVGLGPDGLMRGGPVCPAPTLLPGLGGHRGWIWGPSHGLHQALGEAGLWGARTPSLMPPGPQGGQKAVSVAPTGLGEQAC